MAMSRWQIIVMTYVDLRDFVFRKIYFDTCFSMNYHSKCVFSEILFGQIFVEQISLLLQVATSRRSHELFWNSATDTRKRLATVTTTSTTFNRFTVPNVDAKNIATRNYRLFNGPNTLSIHFWSRANIAKFKGCIACIFGCFQTIFGCFRPHDRTAKTAAEGKKKRRASGGWQPPG